MFFFKFIGIFMCLQTHSMRLLIILKTENEDAVKNIAFWNAVFVPNEAC